MTRGESDPHLASTVRALLAAGRSGDPLEEAVERVREATSSETWSPDSPLTRALDVLSSGGDFRDIEALLDGWLHTEGGVGRYQVESVLGRGGMGEVVAARDTRLDRPVALKFLAHGMPPGVVARFDLEARITAQLTHPNVVPVHDWGHTADGRAFISMKRVDGASLGEKLAEGSVSLLEGIRILDRVCDAMRFAHARGVLHRDIKPDNIMVGAFGEVLVMDWGLARSPSGEFVSTSESTDPANSSLTRVGQIMGTPAYMPPEQARGDRDAMGPHSDVYALGAVLFTLATGRAPFDEGSAYDIVKKVAEGQIPRAHQVKSDVSRDVDAVIARAMSAEPEDRYPTVDAFQADLRQLLEGGRVSVVRYSRLDGLLRWGWKRRAALTAAGSVGIGAALVVATGLVAAVGLASLGTWTYVRDLNAQVGVSQRSLRRQLMAEGRALVRSDKPALAQQRFGEALALSKELGLDERSAWFGERFAASRRGVHWTAHGRLLDASNEAVVVRDEEVVSWLHPGSATLLQQRPIDSGEVVTTGYRVHPLRGEPTTLDIPPVPEGFELLEVRRDLGFVTARAPGQVAIWSGGASWTVHTGNQAVPSDGGLIVRHGDVLTAFDEAGEPVGEPSKFWKCRLGFEGSGCIGQMMWLPLVEDWTAAEPEALEGTRDVDVWNDEFAVAVSAGIVRIFDRDRNLIQQVETRPLTTLRHGGDALAVTNADRGDTDVSVHGIPTVLDDRYGLAIDSDVHPDGLLATSHVEHVVLRDAITGFVFWSKAIRVKSNSVRFDPERPILWTGVRGDLFGLAADTGREVYRHHYPGGINAIAFLDGAMFVVINGYEGQHATVVEVDPETGEVLQSLTLRGKAWDLEVMGDRLVVVSMLDGLGTILDRQLRTQGLFETRRAVDIFGISSLGEGLVGAGIHQIHVLNPDGSGRNCRPEGSRRWMTARELRPGLVYAAGLDDGAVLVDTELCEISLEVDIDGVALTAAIHDGMLWHLGARPQRIDLRERLDVDAAIHASKRGDEAVLRTAYLRAGIHGLAASLPMDDSVDSVRAALIRGPETTAVALSKTSHSGVWVDTARAFAERRSVAFVAEGETAEPP